MKFIKMQGAGNDYVYVNCFRETVSDRPRAAIALSDRHFGVGGDGLICVDPSDVADCKMDMYNLDGSRGKMCGNGVRCVAKLVYDAGIARKPEITVETGSGVKRIAVVLNADGEMVGARVNMGKPELDPPRIPADFPGARAVGVPLDVNGTVWAVTAVSMGNPHCVVFTDDVKGLDLPVLGPQFESHPRFPDRVNTEFIRVIGETELEMRVWERGSGETLACGTGACAAVTAAILNGFCRRDTDVTVHLLGGDLVIRLSDADGCVYMTGPCRTVFTGECDLAKLG